jgi:hypothetical protein
MARRGNSRRARSVLDVIVGEAGGKTTAQRLSAMKDVASAIVNRARALGVSLQDVVSVQREFNAYGKQMPKGTAQLTKLAEQALKDVMSGGVTHNGMFYAQKNVTGNLPKGLKKVKTAVDNHVYFEDPQGRAIGTAKGYIKPSGIMSTYSGDVVSTDPAASGISRGILSERKGAVASDRFGENSPMAPPDTDRFSSAPTTQADALAHLMGGGLPQDQFDRRAAGILGNVPAPPRPPAMPAPPRAVYSNPETTKALADSRIAERQAEFDKRVQDRIASASYAAEAPAPSRFGYEGGITRPEFAGTNSPGLTAAAAGMFSDPGMDRAPSAAPAAARFGYDQNTVRPDFPGTNSPGLTPAARGIFTDPGMDRPMMADNQTTPKVDRLEQQSAYGQPQNVPTAPQGGTVDRVVRQAAPAVPNTSLPSPAASPAPPQGIMSVGSQATVPGGFGSVADANPFGMTGEFGAKVVEKKLGDVAAIPGGFSAMTNAPSPDPRLGTTFTAGTGLMGDFKPNEDFTSLANIAPPEEEVSTDYPEAPANPESTLGKISRSPFGKIAKGGILGGLPGAAIAGLGLLGDRLGPGFDAGMPQSERRSVGQGLSGIMAALGGARGDTAKSLSNPGMSVTSLGNGQSLRRSDRFGWTEVVGPNGNVVGINYDDPNGGGILGSLSRGMQSQFGGGRISKAERDKFSGKAGLY